MPETQKCLKQTFGELGSNRRLGVRRGHKCHKIRAFGKMFGPSSRVAVFGGREIYVFLQITRNAWYKAKREVIVIMQKLK